MADVKKTPEELAFAEREKDELTRRQTRLRYTGDGSAAVAGCPANPDEPEFWLVATDGEVDRITASGLYEHIGDYDAAADEADAAARGPEKEV